MPTALALAWFPSEEWVNARERWPELAELPADHAAYSQRIEARMKWLAKRMPGHMITVSPLAIDELVAAEGERAGTGEARSEQAARILEEGRALTWPPARNDRCWCGSGRKYKQCCGPTAPASDDPDAEGLLDRRASLDRMVEIADEAGMYRRTAFPKRTR
jgi:hypothetical protein